LSALYPSRRLLSARLAAFLQFLKQTVANGMPDGLAAYVGKWQVRGSQLKLAETSFARSLISAIAELRIREITYRLILPIRKTPICSTSYSPKSLMSNKRDRRFADARSWRSTPSPIIPAAQPLTNLFADPPTSLTAETRERRISLLPIGRTRELLARRFTDQRFKVAP